MSRSSDMLAAMIAKKEASKEAGATPTSPPTPPSPPTPAPNTTSTGGKGKGKGKGKGGSGASNPRNNPATFSLGGGVVAPEKEELDYMNATYGESPAEPDSLDTIMSRYTGKVPDYSEATEEFYRKPKDYAAAMQRATTPEQRAALRSYFKDEMVGPPVVAQMSDRPLTSDEVNSLQPVKPISTIPASRWNEYGSTWESVKDVDFPGMLKESQAQQALVGRRLKVDTPGFESIAAGKAYSDSEARDKFQHGMAETRTKALILAAGTKQAGKPPDIARFNRAQEKYRLGLPLRTEDLAPEFQGKAGALDELTAALEALTVEPTYDIDKASRVNPFGA